MNTRRHLLGTLAAAAATPWATLSMAAGSATADTRFVFIVLRGGMDGLAAVPAIGDPAFAPARGALAHFSEAPLPLAGPFALHPLLPRLATMYSRGELLVVHATGLPYKERSHFDAQQVLESGGTRPFELGSGWLARALSSAPRRAVALDTAVPLLLRGGPAVDTWAPSLLAEPAPDLVARLMQMYAGDALLGPALQRAAALRAEGDMAATDRSTMGGGAAGQAVALARKAAEFLRTPGGPQVAVLELGGWDTHANQAAPQGALARNLRTLDAMLGALRDDLGATWTRTVIVAATEFGREVAVNGTQGSDHGSGGAAFVLGGAVAGGRVIADWPGLAPKDRFEGRDLRITTDLRSVLRTVLSDHLQVPRAALDREVLPGSAALPRVDILRG